MASGYVFLINTGTQLLVIPAKIIDSVSLTHDREPAHLFSANGSQIKVFHTSHSTSHFSGHKFSANFLRADVVYPL